MLNKILALAGLIILTDSSPASARLAKRRRHRAVARRSLFEDEMREALRRAEDGVPLASNPRETRKGSGKRFRRDLRKWRKLNISANL